MSQSARTDLPAILVIDDSDDDFDTVVIAAKRAGVGNPLVHLRDAAEARQLFSKLPTVNYAFALLDCNLPGEDGLTLLEELRQHPQYRTLPIIVLTASINPRDRNAFYAAGANAYHVKLVNFTEGIAILENVFSYWLTQVVLPTTDASILGKTRWQ
jgi:two-component system chemotaxis response regulator CheY